MDYTLIPRFHLVSEPQICPPEQRRELIRLLLIDDDADWGLVRSQEALEGQVAYLMGERPEPHYTTDADWRLMCEQ